jgi:hypothetical protein
MSTWSFESLFLDAARMLAGIAIGWALCMVWAATTDTVQQISPKRATEREAKLTWSKAVDDGLSALQTDLGNNNFQACSDYIRGIRKAIPSSAQADSFSPVSVA